ncbi:M16 family metallopeptidase [Corallococcus macrosporus]|nr:insulinase family protein [Corallococcus macrosporus]
MSPPRVSRPPAWRPRAAVMALALLVSACAALPPRGQIVMRDVAFPLRDFRFPSGLRVVVEQDARSPVVAVVAVVGAGGSSDPNGKEGLAHVVEHLAFRSRHAGGPSVWRRLEASGVGFFNASTSLDHTSYETLGPKEALPALLKMEGQRLSAPLAGVSPEVFEVEREVVRNELREHNETGYVGQVFSWMKAAAFPGEHAYSRPLAGTHASLSALSLSDAQRFARAHYRPDNVTLVIAGDVDLAAVEATLQENLPEAWVGTGVPLAMEARLPAQPAAPPTSPAQESVPVYTAAVPTPEVYLSWVLPRGFDEASAVQDFVRATFGRNLAGAMRNDGDIAGITTNLIPGTRASLLVVRVLLSRGDDPVRSAGNVLDQVQKAWVHALQAGAVLDRERSFRAVRRLVVTDMVLESEDLMSRTGRRALLTHFTQDARAYIRSQVSLMGLAGGKVTDFAYQWLQRDRVRIIVVRPGEVPGAATASATLAVDEEPWATPAERVPPSMTAALDSPVQVLMLDNGMEVLLAPRPGLPVVRIGAALGGGSSHGDKAGVADLATWGSFRESWFEGYPSDWGLRSTSSFQRDHLRVGLSGAAGNVGNMLAMLAEQLDTTRTDEYVVRFYREQVLPRRRALDSNPERLAERHLQKALYGTHPYSREATGEDLAEVSWTEADAWLKDVYRPANTVVVIAGEFDVKEVEGLVRKYLGGWSRGTAKPVATPPAPELPAVTAAAKALLTPRPGASQAQVRLACRLPTATPELEARYALMAELIHVHASGEMRFRRGATYGFSARPWLGRGGAAHLVLEGALDAQRMGEGIGTVRDILASFAKEVPARTLERARRGLLAQQAVSFISSEAWVDALLTARVRGFSPEAVTGRPARLQAVTAESLREAFEGCHQRLVVSVTADEGQARSAIQALSQP